MKNNKYLLLNKENEKIIIKSINEEKSLDFKNKGLLFTVQEVKDILPNILDFININNRINRVFKSNNDVELLKNRLCKEFKIQDPSLLDSKDRTKNIVIARQLGHTLLRADNYGSLILIGKLIGNVNHGTVLHSIKIINNMIFTKDVVYYNHIKRMIIEYDLSKYFKIY